LGWGVGGGRQPNRGGLCPIGTNQTTAAAAAASTLS
jgi:hypothetical protein